MDWTSLALRTRLAYLQKGDKAKAAMSALLVERQDELQKEIGDGNIILKQDGEVGASGPRQDNAGQ